ncbi:MAG: class I SAM-dependent methyltransferase [Actinomycetota bacterium]
MSDTDRPESSDEERTVADIVRDGYDRVAEHYAASRDRFENDRHLQVLVELRPPPARVLDVGCGSGVPVAEFLVARGYDVVGIDVSSEQIRLARAAVPAATFEVRDMLELRPRDYDVDALVSFYAIFHTPRERHRELLRTLASFLSLGGIALFTMGASDWEGTEADFHGAEMYWSHFAPEANRNLIETSGFAIELDEIDSHDNEEHQVIVARRL